MKKLLSIILAGAMVLQPFTTVYAEDFEDSFDYEQEYIEEVDFEEIEESQVVSEDESAGLYEDASDEEYDENMFGEDEDGFMGIGSSDETTGVDIDEIQNADVEIETYVNPVFENVFDDSDVYEEYDEDDMLMGYSELLMASAQDTYLSWGDAASVVRSNMISRNTSFDVCVATSYYVGIAGKLWEEALINTENPSEGDYLRYQIAGYTGSVTKGSENVIIHYSMTYLTTLQQENAVTTTVGSILNGLDLSGSDAQKIRAIYTYICENVSYYADEEAASKSTAYAALTGSANSTGISALCYKMIETAGIRCRILYGTTPLGDAKWTIAEVNGQFYHLDAAEDIAEGNADSLYLLRGTSTFAGHSTAVNNRYFMSSTDYDFDSEVSYGNDEITPTPTPVHVHTAGTPVRERETVATCKRTGYYEEVVYCTDCGVCMSRTPVYTPKGAHIPGESFIEEGVEPTCTTPGYAYECVLCDVCYKEISYTMITLTAQHTPGEAYVIERVEPTCGSEGYEISETYCTQCGEMVEHVETPLAKNDVHTPGSVVYENIVPATCAAKGSYDKVVYCVDCGTKLQSNTVYTAKASHVAGEAVQENVVEATCKNEGSCEMVTYCKNCNVEMSRTNQVIPTVDHQRIYTDKVFTKPASLTEEGVISINRCCRDCGLCETVATEAIPRLASIEMISPSSVVYNGKDQTPVVRVTDELGNIIPQSDYVVRCYGDVHYMWETSIKDAAHYKVSIRFKTLKYEADQYVGDYTIEKANPMFIGTSNYQQAMGVGPIQIKMTSDAENSLLYTVDSTKVLKPTSVAGLYNVIAPGIAKITIQTKSSTNYNSASTTVKVTILPKAITVSGVTRAARATTAEVKWTATKDVTGYEIEYANNSSFTNSMKTTVVGATNAKAQITKLSATSNYYVRVRTYYTVDRTTTLYSNWSKTVVANYR